MKKFTEIGGTQYLIKIFTNPHVDSNIKLIALKEETIMYVLANILETIQDDPKFVFAFFRCYENVAKAVACGENLEDLDKYFQSLKKTLVIIGQCAISSLINFLHTSPITKLLTYIFIDTVNSNFVEYSIFIFQKLCTFKNCLEFVYNQCFGLLELAMTQGNKSSGYWDLFSDQIFRIEFDEKFPFLTQNLLTRLYNTPSEANSTRKDEILSGILKILKGA